MVFGSLFLATVCVIVPGQPSRAQGVIEGTVENGTKGDLPVGGAEIVLRVRIDGEFVSVEHTTTAADGSFRFTGLPVDTGTPYLPGANQDGVHFPGARVWLTASEPRAAAHLRVFETSSRSNPLIVESHAIVLQPRTGSLTISETMVITNPSSRCYVGQSRHAGGTPSTLRLSVPSDFERITFQKEAFGRQFAMLDGKLLTGIPWPPGKRELSFTYVIANKEQHCIWQRTLDLPSSNVSLTVLTDRPDDVVCNLRPAGGDQEGERRFESTAESLPAGFVLRLELGHLTVPTIVLARRAAVLVLVMLIAAVSIISVRRRKPAPVSHRPRP